MLSRWIKEHLSGSTRCLKILTKTLTMSPRETPDWLNFSKQSGYVPQYKSIWQSVVAEIDLKNALTQQLQSLHRLGLSALLAGKDGLSFDFSEAQQSPTEASDVQSAPTVTKAAPATAVAESPVGQPDKKAAEPPVKAAVSKPLVAAPSAYQGTSKSRQEREQQLSIIRSEVEACQTCYELCRTRSQTVFGVGNPESKVVFIGEGPGANEDRQGEPFVGEAGKLLDKILTASTLKREQVYILNTVKCRPPNNRNPLPAELENCRGFLDRQLDVIRPEFIVCLGSVAAKSLLGTQSSLGKLRKQFHQYRESKVLVTYHPAYLLITPSAKTYVWEDMKMLMKELGVDL